MTAIALDPLIAEAKERAKRRRLLGATAVVVVAAAVAATFAVESGGSATGVCASVPSGWKERSIPRTSMTETTVVLTNFRFGRMDDFFGLSGTRFPPRGAMVVVSNEGPDASPRFKNALRVTGKDFRAFEGMYSPGTQLGIHLNGRVLTAWAEVGSVTPATVAAVNQALASVRTCSA